MLIIRDLNLPNVALYQAEPRPDTTYPYALYSLRLRLRDSLAHPAVGGVPGLGRKLSHAPITYSY